MGLGNPEGSLPSQPRKFAHVPPGARKRAIISDAEVEEKEEEEECADIAVKPVKAMMLEGR